MARQVPLLPLRIDDVRVVRVDGGLVAVAEQRDEPVTMTDADVIVSARGTTMAVVVLGAAVHIVKRLVVVDGDLVELRDRHVIDETPGLAEIVSLVEATVVADQNVVLIVRVKRHSMVIDMLGLVREFLHGLAAVLGDMQIHVGVVDAVKLVGARPEFVVIVRARATGSKIGTFHPALAAVFRTEHCAGAVRKFDRCVQDVRVLWRNRKACLTPDFFGQAFREFAPGLAAVFRFMDAGCRTAVQQNRDITEFLPRDGVHDIGITRVHEDFRDTRVAVVDIRIAKAVAQNLLPVLASVS